MNFLVTEGYAEAAEKFRMESGTDRILTFKMLCFIQMCMLLFVYFLTFVSPYELIAGIDLATTKDRMAVRNAVQSGNVEDAIEKINDLNPEVCLLLSFMLLMHSFTFVYVSHSVYASSIEWNNF